MLENRNCMEEQGLLRSDRRRSKGRTLMDEESDVDAPIPQSASSEETLTLIHTTHKHDDDEHE